MATDGESHGDPGASRRSAGMTEAGDLHERRVREGLRALVDEMLLQIRSAASHEDAWQPDERRRAEEDLARIMEQVRVEALATQTGR